MGAAELLADNKLLRTEIAALRERADKETQKVSHYEEENERLNEIIRKLKREAFGPSKERWEDSEQILLFNEPESARKPQPDQYVDVKPHKRRRGKRRPLSKNLPREIVVIDLPEDQKVSEEGNLLRPIGKEVSERLVYKPAELKVIEYHRIKYAGPEGDDTVRIADPVPSIIPKSIVTPSLLAHIVTAKYADGTPLYRQEEQFERLGVDIPRCTMARWIITASEKCQPVWNVLEDRLLSSPYVSCDETHTQVLKEDGRTAESKSWMWVRATPSEKQKIVLFDYDPSRSGEVAKRLFAGYEGYLQADGYSAYHALQEQKGITAIGCNMHGRRKFFDAAEGAAKGQSLATEGLRFYKVLYAIEERGRELPWDARFTLRQKESSPIWDQMKDWAEKNTSVVPPKSKIGQAFHYFLEQYDLLRGYLLHGMLEMDNGFAERAIRKFAIGRNNWLFSDTTDGAKASSMFYSFVVTAKINGVNPYTALDKLFTEIPIAKTIDDYERICTFFLCNTNELGHI